ncbi:hypothetical protein LTEGF4_24310 [Limnohabitans sp. TEGF004]|nr:hypothetical protein LTEGF4_24310 [Limnohabitans sp. TEGF004]
MSPAVCLGGSLRTALELGAAWAVRAVAHIMATMNETMNAWAKGERTKCHRAGWMRGVSGCKEGMCEQVMGKLSRLG